MYSFHKQLINCLVGCQRKRKTCVIQFLISLVTKTIINTALCSFRSSMKTKKLFTKIHCFLCFNKHAYFLYGKCCFPFKISYLIISSQTMVSEYAYKLGIWWSIFGLFTQKSLKIYKMCHFIVITVRIIWFVNYNDMCR